MTTAQLVRRYRLAVSFDLDPITGLYPEGGTTPEIEAWTEDVVSLLDEAMVELSAQMYVTADDIALTLSAGVGTYPLSSTAFSQRILEPFSVDVGGGRLWNAAESAYGLWTPAELEAQHPRWYSDTPGTPRRAVFRGDRLVLHPAPSSGGTAYITGKVAPPPLDANDLDAVPGLPIRIHPGIAQLAVYKACKDYAQEESQFNRLASMRDEAFAMAAELERENKNAQVGSSSTSYPQRRERMWM